MLALNSVRVVGRHTESVPTGSFKTHQYPITHNLHSKWERCQLPLTRYHMQGKRCSNLLCILKRYGTVLASRYMYMYVQSLLHVHVYKISPTCTCMCDQPCMYMYARSALHAHVCVISPTCTCMQDQPCMYMYARSVIHVHVCVISPTCTCTCMQGQSYMYMYVQVSTTSEVSLNSTNQ